LLIPLAGDIFQNFTLLIVIVNSTIAGDIFLNFALLALAEFPGYTLSYLGMNYLGRKVPVLLVLKQNKNVILCPCD
jgi:hypothetical protein